MMKRFTLTILGLLLMVGGVMAQAVSLQTSGGQNVNCQQKDGYTEVTFNHNTFNGKWNGYYGSDWVTSYTSGTKHRFIFTFKSGVPSGLDLHFVVTTVEDWNNDESKKLVDVIIADGATSFQYDIEEGYGHIQITNTGESNLVLEVVSITREVIAASSVGKPTITAPATYDGESTAVTITPGANNHHVKYSVSGSSSDVSNVQITSETTIYITGSSDVTITATGYNADESESNTNTATVTYSNVIPSGKTTIANNISKVFSGWGDNLQYNDNFKNKVGLNDYVVLGVSDMTEDNAFLGFRDGGNGWSEEPYVSCTTVLRGNGAKGEINNGETQWWLKVSNNDVLSAFSRQVVIQGGVMSDGSTESPITLNSIDVYKSFAISETENNNITKYDNVVVELTRSFVADTWNTVCLPFALTSDQATQLFGSGYKVAAFTGVNNEIMQFTTLSSNDDFEAGVPYLVNPTKNLSNSSPVVLIDVDLTAKNGSTVTYDGYSFVGTLVQKTFTENLDYTRFVASGNKLKKPDPGSTLKALRAYFILPASFDHSHAPKLSIDGEGEATEIISLDNERVIMDNVYYDLSGRRVMNPTKGLYIVNGHKVIIK